MRSGLTPQKVLDSGKDRLHMSCPRKGPRVHQVRKEAFPKGGTVYVKLDRKQGDSQEGKNIWNSEKSRSYKVGKGESLDGQEPGVTAFGCIQGREAGKGCQAPSLAKFPALWGVWASSSRPEGLRRGEGEGEVSRKGRRSYLRIITPCPNQEGEGQLSWKWLRA